jgi:AcrR family transcriptional regulator
MLTPLRKRADYHHGDLRAAAIQSARKIVEADGLPALGIRKVAIRLNVTPPALYRHFESLEDLQRELSAEIRREIGEFMVARRDRLRVVSSKKQYEIAKLRSLGDSYIEYARENPNLFQAAFFSCDDKLLVDHDELSWNVLQETLNSLASLRMLNKKKSLDASLLAWSAVHGFSMLVATGAISKREYTSCKNSILDSVSRAIVNN